jgi:catechol 2,3-dioxygenase-like lactoylglutathione lyase family enzyme
VAELEHLNINVSDIERWVTLLQRVFGWELRWTGEGKDGQRSAHLGSRFGYLALTETPGAAGAGAVLNHIGVVVDELSAAEERVRQLGYEPYSFLGYAPGRRFYFRAPDGIEIEVVSYA